MIQRRAPRQPRQPARRPRSPPKKKEIWAQAQHDFEAQEKQELSFRAGDLIKILSREQDGSYFVDIHVHMRVCVYTRGRDRERMVLCTKYWKN